MLETVLPEVVEARLVRGKSLWVSLERGVHGGASHARATLPRKATPCNSSCPGRAAVLDKCPCSVLTCRRGTSGPGDAVSVTGCSECPHRVMGWTPAPAGGAPPSLLGLGCIHPALSPILLLPHRTLLLLFVGLELAIIFAVAAAMLYASWYDPEVFHRLLPDEAYANLTCMLEAYANLACMLGKTIRAASEGLLPF